MQLPLAHPRRQYIEACLDIAGCQVALFEWAESYDTKDWDRLAKCIAPTLRVSFKICSNLAWYPPVLCWFLSDVETD
jgi:hypothetical protein